MTRPPTDVIPALLWCRHELEPGVTVRRDGMTIVSGGGFFAEAFPNPDAHEESCRVYWGSHGCERPRGHDGSHWCDCCECIDHPDEDEGCVAGPPYYGPETRFYGDDV